MDFSNVNFTHDCYVDLHVGDYGSLSGLFFTRKEDLLILENIFKESHDWQPSFIRDDENYIMGFVDPGNVQFHAFMQKQFIEEKEHAEKFYRENSFHEQTHDFCEIWFDNDVSDVQISFPIS